LVNIIEATNGLSQKNLDGDKVVSMSQGFGLNNHTVQNMVSPGIEFCPADGEKLIIVPINNSKSYMVAIAGTNENIAPVCNKGERRIFSVSEDGQTLKSFAKFKNDGVLELNGNDNFAVLFNELKTEFNELKGKYNSVVNVLKTWVVAPTDGGLALQTAINLLAVNPLTDPTSSANIDNAKSANVLLKSNT
jgi:hypothetical protein